MLLSDHIVFWHRHRQRPVFTDKEVEEYRRLREKRTTQLCKMATARLVQRMIANNAKSNKA